MLIRLNNMKRNFFCLLLSLIYFSVNSCIQNSKIDRFALVTRHNIQNKTIDSLSSLSVGNGEFAFTVDIAGLQTFPEFYSNGISLGTMSDWGWHTVKNLVFETADFMASYAWNDSTKNRYTLGPILIPAQESLKLETTVNPPFELVYWYWGLKTAQDWKKRLNLEAVAIWADIIEKISQLTIHDGLYLCSEDTKDSYQNPGYMSDHPIVSAISGVLPETRLVDPDIM